MTISEEKRGGRGARLAARPATNPREQAEQALRESEQRYRALVELCPDMIALHAGGRLLYMNPAGVRLAGAQSADELIGMPLMEFVHPDSRAAVAARVRQALERGESAPLATEKFVRLDGRTIQLEVTNVPTTYEGQPAVQAVGRDITQRLEDERALRLSEERFATVFHANPIPSCLVSPVDGRYLAVNDSMVRYTGYSREEMVGRTSRELGLWMEPQAEAHLAQVVREGLSVHDLEISLRTKSGELREALSSLEILEIGGELTILAMTHDVTDRKRMEAAVRQSEARYRQIVETAQEGIWVIDAEGITTFANETMARMLGCTVEEMVGRPLFAYMDEEGRAITLSNIQRRRGGIAEQHDFKFRRTDGTSLWTMLSTAPMVDASGTYLGALAMVTDISERRRAEEGLARTAERLRVLNEFARSVSSKLDVDSITHLIAQEIPPLLECEWCAVIQNDRRPGFAKVRAVGSRNDQVVPTKVGALAETGKLASAEALRTGRPLIHHDLTQASHPALARMAQLGLGSGASVPIVVGGAVWGVLVVAFKEPYATTMDRLQFLESICAHMSVAIHNAELYASLQAAHEELQHTQEQVIQQERLRALGEMASGIAHDFNNALVPIVGCADLLLSFPDDLGNKAKVKRSLELIATAAQDAASVVSRLKEFYRYREDDDLSTPVDLRGLVEHTIALTQPRWKNQAQARGTTIAVKRDLHAVPPIKGEEASLREALTNLMFNAVDAMPEGGTITLRTRVEAEFVVLEVGDTGVGMTEEVRRKCLEPFFTTKGKHGTGLGLSMVHGIVRRHGGTITVESTPGAGTTFTVRLPVGGAPRPRSSVRKAVPSAPSLHVLIVDDDAPMRDVVTEYLGRDGHTAEVAVDGADALRRFRASSFDLVITDRAMPGMSGDQLAAAIKALEPTTPIVLLTGFGTMMQAADERPEGVDLVLGKPVRLNRLREALRTLVKR